MRKLTLSVGVAILLVAGLAYGQIALPMQPVQTNRVVVRVDRDQWKDVSFQADSAAFDNGGVRLTGRVRVVVSGHVMTANSVVITSDLVTLEGNAQVQPPVAR
jgi:hypothetical protein